MNRKILRWIAGTIILLFFTGLIFTLSLLGAFDKSYSQEEMISHFNNHQQEILDLKKYVDSIVPSGKHLSIEFDNNKLRELSIYNDDNTYGKVKPGWHLERHPSRMDSVLKDIGWTKGNLVTIQSKLNQISCIRIESGDPCSIGFQRSGMDMHSYLIYGTPLSDSLKQEYKKKWGPRFFNEMVVCTYDEGAF